MNEDYECIESISQAFSCLNPKPYTLDPINVIIKRVLALCPKPYMQDPAATQPSTLNPGSRL